MPDRKLYIHIGPQKTGSTAIQQGLKHNADKLWARGYEFPDIGMTFGGHHNIIAELCGMDIYQDKLGGLKAFKEHALRSDKHMILSSEVFGQIENRAPLKRLQRMFSDMFEIKIIGYLRPQYELLPSLYKTEFFSRWRKALAWDNSEEAIFLRYGPFEPWCHYALENRRFLNYNFWTRLFDDVFGRDAVDIDIYGGNRFDAFSDFLKKCDIPDPEAFEAPGLTHVSSVNLNFEILRQRYRLKGTKTAAEKKHLDDTIIKADYIITHFLKKASYQGHCSLYNKPLLDKVLTQFQPSNQRLARRRFSRKRLFKQEMTLRPHDNNIMDYFSDAEQAALETKLANMELAQDKIARG